MKTLKLDHTLAEAVKNGTTTSTWRVFDDKNLSVNDEVVLIDKADPQEPTTWLPIGIAKINRIVQKRLGDIGESDMTGHESYGSADALLAHFQKYYGKEVTLETPVKIISFEFSANLPARLSVEPTEQASEVVAVYADGGSRGNPGPSAGGYVIFDDQKRQLVHRGIYLGITTNNQAEYTALKLALEEAKTYGAREVNVYMDSMLVVNQMKGIFKVKNRDLWPIHDSVRQLTQQFKQVTFTHIPRELNKVADGAVNEALDQHLAALHEPGR